MGSSVPVDPLCTGQEEQESKALASWTDKTGKACPLGGVQGRCVLLYNILGNHKSQTGGKTHTQKNVQKTGGCKACPEKTTEVPISMGREVSAVLCVGHLGAMNKAWCPGKKPAKF